MSAPLHLPMPLNGRAVYLGLPLRPDAAYAALSDWHLRYRTRRALSRLPAYLLRDVGVMDEPPPQPDASLGPDHNLRGRAHW